MVGSAYGLIKGAVRSPVVRKTAPIPHTHYPSLTSPSLANKCLLSRLWGPIPGPENSHLRSGPVSQAIKKNYCPMRHAEELQSVYISQLL